MTPVGNMTGSMNDHSNMPASRAAVNQENVVGQVVVISGQQLISSGSANVVAGQGSWRKNQPEKETGE